MSKETEIKPVHAKPSLYAFYFESLKVIAVKYGYNLVLHGSMNRDLDLIALPWQENIGSHDEMIEEFIQEIGGDLMYANGVARNHLPEDMRNFPKFGTTHHGRMQYVINVNRECGVKNGEWIDPQYYIDISVFPTNESSFKSRKIAELKEEIKDCKKYDYGREARGIQKALEILNKP